MSVEPLTLFDDPCYLPDNVVLAQRHYLGPCTRGTTYRDEFGLLVFRSPSSRHLPPDWLELSRWCIWGGPNAGSQQWARARQWLVQRFPDISTVISYSDPSVGHTGALYRACGWLWAPTWIRLQPPPTGNGNWGSLIAQAPKDRWVFPLRRDEQREFVLRVSYASIRRKFPYAEYREPQWKRGKPLLHTGGGNFKRWKEREN